jgi:acetolactate synthase-1/3 small subunit
LALIKVRATPTNRSEILEMANLFRAKVVDVGTRSLVIETTGEEEKIDALYDLLRPFGILELMRTGRVAMVRGKTEGRISDDVGADFTHVNRNGFAASGSRYQPGHYEGV